MPEQPQTTPPVTPQPQVASKAAISWGKVILTVLAIVIVTGLIAGGLWYFVLGKTETDTGGTVSIPTPKQSSPSAKKATESAKKDETAGWKVYTNNDFKFSVKYPSDWVTSEYDYKNNKVLSGDSPQVVWGVTNNPPEAAQATNYLKSNEYSFGVVYYKPTTAPRTLINKKIDELKKTYEVNNIQLKKFEKSNTTANGYQAVSYYAIAKSSTEGPALADRRTYVIKGNEVFEVNGITPSNSDLNKFDGLYDNYLSTFKFLD